jgi:lysophospholipase L1-like esterase
MYGILIFGDSIAAGRGVDKVKSWPLLLTQYLDKEDKWSIFLYNLSIPGQSSKELVKRFSIEAKARCKKIYSDDHFTIIFAIGINDAKCTGSKNNPVISQKNFKNNIKLLISNARKYTDHIIFIGPTLVDEKKTTPIDKNYFFNEKILNYSNIIKNICAEIRISFIDMANDWRRQNYKKFLASDGLHLNEQGHKIIYQKIIKNFSFKK